MPIVRTSARAIIQRDGTFLVSRYEAPNGVWYTFPGGGQLHSEDLHQALRRELLEELGAAVDIGPLRFVRECLAARNPGPGLPADFHQVELYFECSLLSEPGRGHTPDPHQTGFAWLSIAELRALTFHPAALLDALSAPGLPAYLGAIP